MNRFSRFWRQRFLEFSLGSDFFRLSDSICLISEKRLPQTKSPSIRVVWTILSLLHAFQYGCFVAELINCINQTPLDKDKFTAVINLVIPLGVAILRGICLAYHREVILQLKQYINSKSCQQADIESFELRKKKYRKVNRYLAAFHCLTTANSFTWALTGGLNGENVIRIPVNVSNWSKSFQYGLDVGFALIMVPWCFTLWHSPTQFVTILSVLHSELRIIVNQFDGLFEKVVSNYALDPIDLDELELSQRGCFWAELDKSFKNAIRHHSAYIRNFQLLRKMSSLNFFIFLCLSAVIITFNIFPFIVNPSFELLPLQLLAMQYASESYLCCTMFDNLEAENQKISKYVYAIDWLSSMRHDRHNVCDRIHRRSIEQNAIILHQQINKGLSIKAGGMFPLNLATFTQLMKSVYSLLTLLLQSMD
ncbi:uncharacterized protein LOC134208705 [Armigeres subalbatus]|uniref:uncharacterized protein LOC134208705 n=1 Tax=Armigeres subalbatus TaxID=124917 RepID=UPI002ED69A7E